ncbi:MAG: hypothetical protein IKR25_02805 [Muribaculaceae bacterium]|nr:hypothetical protein [Muribaculaceae bacterium]
MMCNFFCGGDRTEAGIGYGPGQRLCSPDTVLRVLEELATDNTVYTSDKGKLQEVEKAVARTR